MPRSILPSHKLAFIDQARAHDTELFPEVESWLIALGENRRTITVEVFVAVCRFAGWRREKIKEGGE